jgi:hypothetical protein
MERHLRACIAQRTAAAEQSQNPARKVATRDSDAAAQKPKKAACSAQEKLLLLCDQ